MVVSVCPSVTSRCSTETAKCIGSRKQRRTIDVFWCQKILSQNSNRVSPNGGAKCRWCRLNAGAACSWKLATFHENRCELNSVATLSVHLICLQNVRRDAARCAALSATADPYLLFAFVVAAGLLRLQYRYQLSQTNPRDALHHGKRASNKGGRSVW